MASYPNTNDQYYQQHQQQQSHRMSQSSMSGPAYTPLSYQVSPHDQSVMMSPPAAGPANYTQQNDAGGAQYAMRPASYHSIHGDPNGSGIHLASPPNPPSLHSSVPYYAQATGNGNGNSNGPDYSNSHNNRNSMYMSSSPMASPSLSISNNGDPTSPYSAVPLLLHNGGYGTSMGPMSPPSTGTGGGGGFYSPPPPFSASLSSPTVLGNSAGAGGNNNNPRPRPLTQTSSSSGKTKGVGGGIGSKIEQRRLSSFKHSNYDYKHDPTLRRAYLSKTQHFASIWLPFLGFCAILGGMWAITIATQVQDGHMIEIKSEKFYNFGVDEPTLLVAAYTFISSILNGCVLWCFSCAVLSYARYRLSLGRPISLRGLSALSSAQGGQMTFNNPISSKWTWLLLFCWACFLTTTTGFNTILLPTRRTVSQEITTTELDMTSPSFSSFYNANTGGGVVGGGSYYDCSRWTSVRGLLVGPCPAGTAFTATTYAGRSHFESRELGELTYIRLGAITYTGTTWGTLPFTSFTAFAPNSFASANTLPRYPSGRQNFSIILETQGLRARISCADSNTSPLSMDPALTTSPLACNPDTPIPSTSPDLRMRAGYCNSTSAPANGGAPTYDFYMRFNGAYINEGTDGTRRNENVTCSITPFASLEKSNFNSNDNSSWVEQIRPLTPQEGMYPRALVERILDNIANMVTIFGQNSIDNLIAEQFVTILTAYFEGDYSKWPLVAQRQLEGMFAFLASYERILAESATAGNADVARVTRAGQLQHDTFAYAVTYPTYLLLIPITLASLLGMWFLIKSASFRHVPKFDPLCITSLVVASSTSSHSLFLDEAAIKGAAPDDKGANDAHVAFTRDENTGQFGLERIPC